MVAAGGGGGGTAGRGGGDGGTGFRGGIAAGRDTGAAACGFGAGFAVSSSAIMRRMEARISSIDGSCAFAGWLITTVPATDVPQESSRQPD